MRIPLVLLVSLAACTPAPVAEPGSMPGSPDPEAFVAQVESFVATYVADGVDRSSSGLPILCEQGRESCRSKRRDLHDRCVAACAHYRRVVEDRARPSDP